MVNFPKFRTLYSILLWLKFCFLFSGMASSVDPDQTAPDQTAPEGAV